MPKSDRTGSQYAISKGRETGVFDSYKDKVRPSTDGYPSNIHQKFPSQEAAEKALRGSGGPSFQDDRHYAVRKGHQPGFYPDWIQAAPQVLGYPDGECRRFKDHESAQKWMDGENEHRGSSCDYGCGQSLRDSDFTESYTKRSNSSCSGSRGPESSFGGNSGIHSDFGAGSSHGSSGSRSGSGQSGSYEDDNDDDVESYDGEDNDDDGDDYDDDDDDGNYDDD
ncbi:hypothetical protein ABW21_db0202322 [Orbilia brochopaga]|nr:hypothetical protein ABW21_db0202322 [Drechslerella brochopaga]